MSEPRSAAPSESGDPSSAPALPRSLSRKLKAISKPVAKSVTDSDQGVPIKVEKRAVAPTSTTDALLEALEQTTGVADPTSQAAPSGHDAAVQSKDLRDGQRATQPPDEPILPDEGSGQDELDDPKTDAAVDDIMRRESDALLDTPEEAGIPHQPVQLPKHRHHFFKKWLGTTLGRWLTFAVLLAIAGGVFAVPTARYALLNRCGVRASLSVTVIDAGTLLPLQGVQVSVEGRAATTGKSGVATLHGLRLGDQTLILSRVAYAAQTHSLVVGWGENPIGNPFSLAPTGVRYVVKTVDYFSGRGVPTGTATESDNSVVPADKNGIITLTLNTNGTAFAPATVGAPGYIAVAAALKPGVANVVTLVPDTPEVYMAKQSGRYSVYAANADGSNAHVLLAGTGLENSQLSLAVAPDSSEAALVSLRDSLTDVHGTAEQALTLIAVPGGAAITIDHADHIKLLDWDGATLTYQTMQDAFGPAPAQIAVVSYNYKTQVRQQLAAGADFNAVLATQGVVFYAPSSSDAKAKLGLFRVNEDGSAQQTLLSDEVIGLSRTDYNTVLAQTANAWYLLSPNTSAAPQHVAAPASVANTSFAVSPDSTNAAAVVNGALQITNIATGKTTSIAAPTPSYPLRWLGDHTVAFRVGGAAPGDYGASIDGGGAKKIVGVLDAPAFATQSF